MVVVVSIVAKKKGVILFERKKEDIIQSDFATTFFENTSYCSLKAPYRYNQLGVQKDASTNANSRVLFDTQSR
jgi:hypothetical protein